MVTPVPFDYGECYLNGLKDNAWVGSDFVKGFTRTICSEKGNEAISYLSTQRTGWSVKLFAYQTSAPTFYHAFIKLTDHSLPKEYGYSAGPENLVGAGGLLDQIGGDEDAFGRIVVFCSDRAFGCYNFENPTVDPDTLDEVTLEQIRNDPTKIDPRKSDIAQYTEFGGPSLVISAGYGDANTIKDCLSDKASQIAYMRQTYHAQGPNSNTFVSALLKSCDLPNVEPDGALPHGVDNLNFPGWNNRQLD